MEGNTNTRGRILGSGGNIESCFSQGKYSAEFRSATYDQLWLFNLESLPGDLIRRYDPHDKMNLIKIVNSVYYWFQKHKPYVDRCIDAFLHVHSAAPW